MKNNNKKRCVLVMMLSLLTICANAQISIKDYEHDKNWYVLPENSKYSLTSFIDFYKNSFSLSRYDTAGVNNVNVSDLPNGIYNIKTKDSVSKLVISK